MYGIILCSGCGSPRVIDLSSARSKCPRCAKAADHHRAKVHMRSPDQGELRDAMWSLHSPKGFFDEEPPAPKETDPRQALVRRLESISDPEERLAHAARVLSGEKGHFLREELEELLPEEAEAMLKAMVEQGIVYEPRPGRYQRI